MNQIYYHIRTKQLYRIIGKARSVYDPGNKLIVYSQLYNSHLLKVPKTKDTFLPSGTIWTRSEKDFFNKFRIAKKNKKS